MEYKTLCVKRIGWRRIANNQMRFGWNLENAEQETETTTETTYDATVYGDTVHVTPHTTTSTKVRVWLYFCRDIVRPTSVVILELFYNLIFFVRKILAFLLPFGWIATLFIALFGDIAGEFSVTYFGTCTGATIIWLLLIILEGVFARIAQSILRKS